MLNLGYCSSPRFPFAKICNILSYPLFHNCTLDFNPLNANVALIQKPDNWFAQQIDWLVSIWGQHWHLMSQRTYMQVKSPVGLVFLNMLFVGLRNFCEQFKHNFFDTVNSMCSCGNDMEAGSYFFLTTLFTKNSPLFARLKISP